MFGVVVFLFCITFCGSRVTAALAAHEPEPLTVVERTVWTSLFACGFWIAQGTLLSLVGLFSPLPLLASAVVVLVAVAAATRDRPLATLPAPGFISGWADRCTRAFGRHIPVGPTFAIAIAALAVLYSMMALAVLPVSNHDALSYHFPKAMRLITTHAFGLYPSSDLRVTYSPGNYEMLVGTLMMFLRSDRATGLITSVPLALFLATGFILFTRVWRDQSAAALTVPVMLASPVLFLHVTSHKNDILIALFTLNGLLWLARAAVHGGRGSVTVGLVALALAAGTKYHGLFAVLASSVLLWTAWRKGVWRPTLRTAMLHGLCTGLLFLVLGSVQYVANLAATGQVTGPFQIPTPNGLNTVLYPAYRQLPRFAWMFLLAPFTTEGQYFHVPWSSDTWFWPAYELYFSHYGMHVSLLILSLPLAVWWSRRRLDEHVRRELALLSTAALIMTLLIAMIGLRPYGSFAFIPRFLFFALPVLLVWTWCPAIIALGRSPLLRDGIVVASLALPMASIDVTVQKDAFSPLRWVYQLWVSPERRRDVFIAPWRATLMVDRVAPPDATVAIDGGYDGWSYPMYGAALSRRVEVIMYGPGRYVPARDVDWVAIDRAVSIVWGHPDFQSMAVARRYIDQGSLTERDRRVYDSLITNPDFERVYFLESRFQAVFRRIGARQVESP
jgi:hypothetical protein